VVWISEDLDDLLNYAHRIAVIHNGSIIGMAKRQCAERQTLGRWMAGHATEAA
jgi:simple sugar transport system ATP-binding protein